MKKINLIKNQELFQGKKYLSKNKMYFEGWYFKNTSGSESISFIPGISISEEGSCAFIQVITNDNSYYIDYDIEDFVYSEAPFYIKIGENHFSKDRIYINIDFPNENIKIEGMLKYSNTINIKSTKLCPNIMGPFSYISFMECYHAIISMKSLVNGFIEINEKLLEFSDGLGYIEKDWGYSFPKTYLWCQANNFKKTNASFMFSTANIPFKFTEFKGLICVLIIDDEEYKFTTYNGAKLIDYKVDKKLVSITMKKGDYILDIRSPLKSGLKLSAPVKGKMDKEIFETIDASIYVKLKKDKDIIFSDKSTNCGLEIV